MKQSKLEAVLALLSDDNSSDQPTTDSSSLNGFAVGQKVIIRTYSAGVFFGELKERNGLEGILKNSRRIYSWEGAFTLSAVSQDGISGGRLSKAEPEKLVTEIIEVIPCSPQAIQNLESKSDYDPS